MTFFKNFNASRCCNDWYWETAFGWKNWCNSFLLRRHGKP